MERVWPQSVRSSCVAAALLATIPVSLQAQTAGQDQGGGQDRDGRQPGGATDPSQPQPPPSPAPLNDIVVTGTTSSKRTVLTSSVALTVATAEDLERKAPRSTAQALELVPGIFVEGSGGEVSNNFSVRGLAGGGQQFIQLSEDGLPVFYTDALSDTILKQDIMIERLEAVRGGTSGILTVNGAGATINFITRKPDFDRSTGSFRLTTSSYGTARVDGFYTAPIAEDLAFSIGGFFRASDGIRDTKFRTDQGYLVRAALSKRFGDGGHLTINLKHVNDHNTFFTPMPLRNSEDPQGVPGLSPTQGTLLGPDLARFTVRTTDTTGAAFKDIDLHNGVHTKSTSIGYDFAKDLTDGLTVFGRGRYTHFRNNFNSVFSFDNAGLQLATDRLDPAKNAQTALMLATFAPRGAVRAGLRVVGSGEIITDPAAMNGNGLTAENVAANNFTLLKEFASDTGIRWEVDRDGFANSLTVGALYFRTRSRNNNFGASTFISDVRDNARRLDLVALDAAGNVIGQLTENGFLNYGTFGEGGARVKQDSISIYANDELRIGEKLRLDGGLRFERFTITRFEAISQGSTPIPGAVVDGVDQDDIIANNAIAQFGGGSFTGQYKRQHRRFNKIAWTIGANYLIAPNLSLYARYAQAFQAQAQNPPTDLDFAEAGIRYQSRTLSIALTGFRTIFKDYLFSRQLPGQALPTEFSSDIKVYGGEFDIQWHPVKWFRIQANGVLQKSKIDIKDDQGTGFSGQFDGNSPERTPPINITVTPSIILPRGEIYVSYKRLGRIYPDIANSIKLPGYGILSAGFTYDLATNVRLAVNVDNITDELGLTEGNPRAGFAELPSGDYFFARPIFGRNAVASLTFDF